MVTHTHLEPVRPGDVFATIGSGNKLHVFDKGQLNYETMRKMARCGRRGSKVRRQQQHVVPPNVSEFHAVCFDCREFCRGVTP